MDEDASYNVAVIRQLLNAAFTVPMLWRFCEDRQEFRAVVAEFSPHQGLAEMVDHVIAFCRTRCLWDDLLKEIQAENPRQYERFGGQLSPVATPSSRSPLVFLHNYGSPPAGLPADTLRIDWSEHFDRDRRRVPAPAVWEKELIPELVRHKAAMGGGRRLCIQSTAALSSGFALGSLFRSVDKYEIEIVDPQIVGGPCLSTAPVPPGHDMPGLTTHLLDGSPTAGDALVVVHAVRGTPIEVVMRSVGRYWNEEEGLMSYKNEAQKPRLGAFLAGLVLEADTTAMSLNLKGWEMAELAQLTHAHVSRMVGKWRPKTLHLFLAVSAPLAILMGHRWNAIDADVQCYEYVDGTDLYAPTCRLSLR